MSDCVISDPTATNQVECPYYAPRSSACDGVGLFVHPSEHVFLEIMTPTAKVGLSNGRLHQQPTRDPTNQFHLSDYLTWQMNVAIAHKCISLHSTRIREDTMVPPTVHDNMTP